MSSQKDRETKENLEKCYNLVQQSSVKGGISATELAKKLSKHRTTIHSYLNSLELAGRVESQHGTWLAKTGEQTPKFLEKEIIIELPIPKNEWQRLVLLEDAAKNFGGKDPNNIFKISLDRLKETRTIRIRGKNVDHLDLEKVASLIRQANESSFRASLRGVFKSLRGSNSRNSKSQESSEA
jgi:hypothetical protein